MERGGRRESLRAAGTGELHAIESGSQEEFITEHDRWLYRSTAGCSEYQVEHPRWRVRRCVEATLDAEISSLYGERFVESSSACTCFSIHR